MSKRPQSEQPWKVAVPVTDVPETGRRIELVADGATRAAIAKLGGLAGLPRLEAQFDLSRHGREGLHVVGRVTATVKQNCVVTLEPLQTDIDETVDLIFADWPSQALRTNESERIYNLDEDTPQSLDNGMVDLGAIAVESLFLGIDPYPRAAGAVFNAPPAGEPPAHPFAALAVLKKDQGRHS
jgi:hypothetical protein